MFARSALAAPTRTSLRHRLVRGLASASPHPAARPKVRVLDQKPDPKLFEDHRKSWFFTVNKIGNFLIIPTVVLYAVFFHDFGEHEHVFSPARRWLDAQKAAFFNLSPEERKLAEGSTPQAHTTDSTK